MKQQVAVIKIKKHEKVITNKNEVKEKIVISEKDINIIKRWLLTGSFNNVFLLNDEINKNKTYLIKRLLILNPELIQKLMLETLPQTINKKTHIYTLILLSSGNFKAKKIYSDLFNTIISDLNDLYIFMEYCKRERGFGNLIHNSINKWFKNFSNFDLEKMFISQPYGNNWKISDIFKLIKINPIDNNQKILFDWAVNKKFNYNEHKDKFFLLNIYQKIKENKKLNQHEKNILYEQFTPKMVPSNYPLFKDFNKYNLLNYNQKEYPIYNIPKFLPYLNEDFKKNITSVLEKTDILNKIDYVTLLSIYKQILQESCVKSDYDILNEIENNLENKIEKNKNNYINIIDICESNDNLKFLKVKPEEIISILIGKANIVVDMFGNDLSEQNVNKIINRKIITKFVYNKSIFNKFKNIDSKYIIIWTNNKKIDKNKIYRDFEVWKKSYNKNTELIFINVCNPNKNIKNAKIFYKDIYIINNKFPVFFDFLKKGEL